MLSKGCLDGTNLWSLFEVGANAAAASLERILGRFLADIDPRLSSKIPNPVVTSRWLVFPPKRRGDWCGDCHNAPFIAHLFWSFRLVAYLWNRASGLAARVFDCFNFGCVISIHYLCEIRVDFPGVAYDVFIGAFPTRFTPRCFFSFKPGSSWWSLLKIISVTNGLAPLLSPFASVF